MTAPTWENSSGDLGLTAFVNNVEDETVFANSSQSSAKAGVIYNQLRPPRTLGIRLLVRM